MTHRRQLTIISRFTRHRVRQRPFTRLLGPEVGFRGGDLLHVVHSSHRRRGLGSGDCGFRIQLGGHAGPHRSERTQVLGQRPGIDTFDAEDVIFR